MNAVQYPTTNDTPIPSKTINLDDAVSNVDSPLTDVLYCIYSRAHIGPIERVVSNVGIDDTFTMQV